jgi:tape measure domain-containing protein
MSLGALTIELEVNGTKFNVQMKNAGNVIRQFTREVGSADRTVKAAEASFGKLFGKMRDLAIIGMSAKTVFHGLKATIWDWQSGIIGANAQIERMTQLLKGMSHAASDTDRLKDAQANVKSLIDLSKEAPFSMQEMTNSFVKFSSVNLDKPLFQVKTLTDAIANFGGTDEILHRATLAIQQMASKGIVSMEELRQQLGEAVPNAIQLMALGLQRTVGKLTDQISKGVIDAKPAIQRMMDQFELSFAGSGNRMMQTWDGLIGQLKTAWLQFLNDVGGQGDQTGYFQLAKQSLQELITLLSSGEAKAFARDLGEALSSVVSDVKDLVGWTIRHREEVLAAAKAVGAFMLAWKGATLVRSIIAGLGREVRLVGVLLASMGRSVTASNLGILGTSAASAAVSLTRLGGVLRTLAAGIGFLAGPISGLITLLGSAAAAWWAFGKAGSDAYDRIAKKKGLLQTQDELDEASKGLEEKIKSLDDLNARLIDKQNKLSELERPRNRTFLASEQRAKLRKEVEELKKEAAALQDEIENAEFNFSLSKTVVKNNKIDQGLAEYKIQIDKELDGISSIYRGKSEKLLDEITKAEKAGNNKLANELRQEVRKNIEETTDARIAMLENKRKTLESTLSAKTGEDRDIAQAQLAALNQALLDFKERRADILKRFDDPDEVLVFGKGSKTTKIPAYITLLDQLKEKAAQLRAQLDQRGSTGFLDGLDQKIKDLAARKDIPELYRNQIRALGGEIEHLAADNKLQDEIDRLNNSSRQLEEQLHKTNREMNLFARLAQGDFGDPTKHSAERLEAFKKAAERNQSLIDEQKRIQNAEFADDKITDMRQKTLDARKALLVNETEIAENEYQEQLVGFQRFLNSREFAQKFSDEKKKAFMTEFNAWQVAEQQRIADISNRPLIELAERWGDMTSRMKEAAAGWLEDTASRLADFVTTGKANFSDLVESILKDIARLQIQENLSPLVKALSGGSLFDGIFGGTDFSSIDASSSQIGGGTAGVLYPGASLANGGIMTGAGEMMLRKYANGGVAYSPQLALFGEGSMPEAFVPLPDGRSIPVTFSGQLGSAAGGAANVIINVHEAPGTRSRVNQQRDQNGDLQIDILVEQIETRLAGSVTSGSGALPGAIEGTYGLNRTGGKF